MSSLRETEIYELMSITRNNQVTLSAALLFSPYPQAYFPQLCITAVVVPGTEVGQLGEEGERFLDNLRIEGNIPEMLDGAIQFVRKNVRKATIINPITGQREDRTEYPITAVREAVLNALVHRDYSIHTEGMPIQLLIFDDRMEILKSRRYLRENKSKSAWKSAARYKESGISVCIGDIRNYRKQVFRNSHHPERDGKL